MSHWECMYQAQRSASATEAIVECAAITFAPSTMPAGVPSTQQPDQALTLSEQEATSPEEPASEEPSVQPVSSPSDMQHGMP